MGFSLFDIKYKEGILTVYAHTREGVGSFRKFPCEDSIVQRIWQEWRKTHSHVRIRMEAPL